MLRKLTSTMTFPQWAGAGTRWRELMVYDKILDGKLYEHLSFAFYDETDGGGGYVPLHQRRPSCQYRLPRYLARWAARKLFAGRHVPKVRVKGKGKERDLAAETLIADLLTGTKIWPIMYEAAYRGSVGSVAVTFRVDEAKVGLKVWRALWCSPSFDDFGELVGLRTHYVTSGAELRQIGIAVEKPTEQYWFIRDYTTEAEITYVPPLADEWNPVEGFRDPDRQLVPGETVEHGLGFVPAIWIMNPGGTTHPDGAALWADAIPNVIEIDYLMSQAARGARYSCAPQLVIMGELREAPGSQDGGVNPTTVLYLNAGHKDMSSGELLQRGEAKLLEMNGSGAEAAMKIVETLKKFALEQVGIVQKDPGEMPGPLSGRAMEYLDEDAHDTAMQYRTTYGEGGALALIAKILRVLAPDIDVSKLWLQWPRIYLPTPGDLQAMAQALQILTTPTAVPGAKPSEDGAVPTLEPLMDIETARAYLEANLDLGILDDTEGDAPVGPSGGDPAPVDEDDPGVMQVSPFWRILPPRNIPV